MNEYDTEGDTEHPPKDHAEWFMQLPRTTRHWIENLNPEKMKDIDDAIKMKHRVEAGGWFIKWLSITVVSFFVGAAAFEEAIQKLIMLLIHGGKP